jgi:hypothetical protein
LPHHFDRNHGEFVTIGELSALTQDSDSILNQALYAKHFEKLVGSGLDEDDRVTFETWHNLATRIVEAVFEEEGDQ